uniref:Uncharacterized protein n=1 Tax=Arundo donax TaxID=35708 RepID=A0A0A8ZXZ1_ARUDO
MGRCGAVQCEEMVQHGKQPPPPTSSCCCPLLKSSGGASSNIDDNPSSGSYGVLPPHQFVDV